MRKEELVQKIRDLEGFVVKVINENGREVRKDAIISKELNSKASPKAKTARWYRDKNYYADRCYDFLPLMPDGSPAVGNMTLRRLREEYGLYESSN